MPPLISLDDDAALDPAVVGVKAANLAKARRAGLPVLPGVVVPIKAGRAGIELGLEVLRAEGPGKARLAVDRKELPVELAGVLTAAGASLGGDLILRSSTTLDDDDRFSGAFASIGGVRPAEVDSAVRGCWSSVFSASSLARFDGAELPLDGVGIAVLMQPMLDPELGGTAELLDDGTVTITAVRGRPGPLLAGGVSGARGSLTDDCHVPDSLVSLGLSRELGSALAATAHGARLIGANRIEWAVEGGRPWVLQTNGPSPTSVAAREIPTSGPPGPDGGIEYRGIAASSGRATGRPLVVTMANLDGLPDPANRILVLDHPLSVFAPLLYRAAALVALEGSESAHLCTVARSLHVPAVVGVAALMRGSESLSAAEDSWVVVDGDAGTVVLHAAA